MAQLNSKRIMIVEDEAIAALSLQNILQAKGYEVTNISGTLEEAINNADLLRPDLVLMDINLEGPRDGIEASKEIYARFNIPVIFLTSYSQETIIQEATHTGPFAYLLKPVNTKELTANIEIALLKHKAETHSKALDQTRQKFFSIISHDLRSPLAALVQTTRIMQLHKGELTPEDFDFFINEINETASNLYKLTDNLLEWTQIHEAGISYKPERVLLFEKIQKITSLLKRPALNKFIDIEVNMEESLCVWVDRIMIISILNNLISNSIKFSHPHTTIIITARKINNQVEIKVEDKGIGIDPEKLKDIFTGSYKREGTSQEKGTGLGLMLTKEFVEINKGSIEVKSIPNDSTSFTLLLPCCS